MDGGWPRLRLQQLTGYAEVLRFEPGHAEYPGPPAAGPTSWKHDITPDHDPVKWTTYTTQEGSSPNCKVLAPATYVEYEVASTMTDIEPIVRKHSLVSTECESQVAWNAVLAVEERHACLLRALRDHEYPVVDSILTPIIQGALEKYKKHHDFWFDYYSKAYRCHIEQCLSSEGGSSFILASMKNHSLDKRCPP